MTKKDKIEISGESWKRELTQEEYDEWVIYSNKTHLLNSNYRFHPSPISYENVLDMFLCNYRMKVKEEKKISSE